MLVLAAQVQAIPWDYTTLTSFSGWGNCKGSSSTGRSPPLGCLVSPDPWKGITKSSCITRLWLLPFLGNLKLFKATMSATSSPYRAPSLKVICHMRPHKDGVNGPWLFALCWLPYFLCSLGCSWLSRLQERTTSCIKLLIHWDPQVLLHRATFKSSFSLYTNLELLFCKLVSFWIQLANLSP